MVVDTDWAVEQYRTKFEPLDHWNLKVEFMEAHKALIEEERLVCLAQVYVNVELLGCRYPTPVMLQVGGNAACKRGELLMLDPSKLIDFANLDLKLF